MRIRIRKRTPSQRKDKRGLWMSRRTGYAGRGEGGKQASKEKEGRKSIGKSNKRNISEPVTATAPTQGFSFILFYKTKQIEIKINTQRKKQEKKQMDMGYRGPRLLSLSLPQHWVNQIKSSSPKDSTAQHSTAREQRGLQHAKASKKSSNKEFLGKSGERAVTHNGRNHHGLCKNKKIDIKKNHARRLLVIGRPFSFFPTSTLVSPSSSSFGGAFRYFLHV
jgi:hypothetical protein